MGRALAAVAGLLLAGCGGVWCVEPASDDTNTAPDARLVGFWRAEQPGEQSEPWVGLFAVGMKAKPTASKSEMEVVAVGLGPTRDAGPSPDHAGVDVARGALRTTTIGGRKYMSVSSTVLSSTTEVDRGSKALWFVARYEMPDESTLHVHLMDQVRVAADVRAGVLTGTAETSRVKAPLLGEIGDPIETVTLDGATRRIRSYLQTRGDDVFLMSTPLVFRRVPLGP